MIGTTPNARLEQLRERLASLEAMRELAFDDEDEEALETINELFSRLQQAEQALAKDINKQRRIEARLEAIEEQSHNKGASYDEHDSHLEKLSEELDELDAERERLLERAEKAWQNKKHVNDMLKSIREDEESLTAVLSPLIGEFGDTLKEVIASGQETLEQGLTDFIEQAGELFKDEIKALTEFEESVSKNLETFSEFAQEAFDAFYNSLDEATQKDISDFFDEIDATIDACEKVLEEARNELDRLADSIGIAVTELVDDAHEFFAPESFFQEKISEASLRSEEAEKEVARLDKEAQKLEIELLAITHNLAVRQGELQHHNQQAELIQSALKDLKTKEGDIPIVKNIRSFFNRSKRAEYNKQLDALKPIIAKCQAQVDETQKAIADTCERKDAILQEKEKQEKKHKKCEKEIKTLKARLKERNANLADRDNLLDKIRAAEAESHAQKTQKVSGAVAIAQEHMAKKIPTRHKLMKDDKKALLRARKAFSKELSVLSRKIDANRAKRKDKKNQLKKTDRKLDRIASKVDDMFAEHERLQSQQEALEGRIEEQQRQVDALYRQIDMQVDELDERVERTIESAFDASWERPLEDTLDKELVSYFQSKYSANENATHSMHTSLEGLDKAMLALLEEGKEDEVIRCLFVLHDMDQVPELNEADIETAFKEVAEFRSSLATVVAALPEPLDFDFDGLLDELDEETAALPEPLDFDFDGLLDELDDESETFDMEGAGGSAPPKEPSEDEIFKQVLSQFSQGNPQNDNPMVQAMLDTIQDAVNNYQKSVTRPGSVFQSFSMHQNQYMLDKRALLKEFILESHALLESLGDDNTIPADKLSEYKDNLQDLHQRSHALDAKAGKPSNSHHPLNNAIESALESLPQDTQKSKQSFR